MKISLAAALAALAACSHHADSPLPAPPKDSGITLARDGDGVIVTDTIGGYQLRLPGAPERVTAEHAQMDGETHAVVQLQMSAPGAGLSLAMFRFGHGELSAPDALGGFYDGLADRPGAIREPITLAGHPALHLHAPLAPSAGGGELHEWAVYTPEHDVAYVVMVRVGPGDHDTPLDHIIETFRPAGS